MADRRPAIWPRRMKIFQAAAYVGESESTFRKGVKSGKWPEGIADGGNVYWYLEDLDERLDMLKTTSAAQHCSDPEWQAVLDG